MKIKPYQYALFLGSITAIVLYVRRRAIKGFLNKNQYTRKLLSNFAIQWVGTKEVGNNNGWANDLFEKMMKEVGWTDSDQWCMYFAKMVHYNTFPNEKAKINNVLTGSTQQSYDNAKNDKTGTYSVFKTPQVGDIIIYQQSSNPSKGHAGVVTKVLDNGKIETVEGNTNDKSIASGVIVAKKTRPSAVGSSIGGGLIVRGYIRKNSLI